MTTRFQNPQSPDPFKPKMRLKEFCERYGISPTTGLSWIRRGVIAAEQPGGPKGCWFVLIEKEDDEDGTGEAMLLAMMEKDSDTRAA